MQAHQISDVLRAPPAIALVGPCVGEFFLTQFLPWFGLEPRIRRGGAKKIGAAVCEPESGGSVSLRNPEVPKTQLLAVHSIERDSCVRLGLAILLPGNYARALNL